MPLELDRVNLPRYYCVVLYGISKDHIFDIQFNVTTYKVVFQLVSKVGNITRPHVDGDRNQTVRWVLNQLK